MCKRVISSKYGETFEVTDVEGRTLVRFHWGNTDDNTEGCIITGEEFGRLKGDVAVLGSRRAFKEFMTLLNGYNEFYLTITDSF